jgi:hypothetical protein
MYHRVQYEGCGATFLLVCPKCNRFVKADATIKVYGDGYIKEDVPNATCSKHGRVAMPFEGYY